MSTTDTYLQEGTVYIIKHADGLEILPHPSSSNDPIDHLYTRLSFLTTRTNYTGSNPNSDQPVTLDDVRCMIERGHIKSCAIHHVDDWRWRKARKARNGEDEAESPDADWFALTAGIPTVNILTDSHYRPRAFAFRGASGGEHQSETEPSSYHVGSFGSATYEAQALVGGFIVDNWNAVDDFHIVNPEGHERCDEEYTTIVKTGLIERFDGWGRDDARNEMALRDRAVVANSVDAHLRFDQLDQATYMFGGETGGQLLKKGLRDIRSFLGGAA